MSELASLVVTQDGEVVVASLTGEIDLSNATELERSVADLVPNGALGLVLDLSGLTYIDSSGIRLLLSLAGRLRWRGQELALAAPDGARCRRVLSMAGVDGSVAFETTAEAAGARLREPGMSG